MVERVDCSLIFTNWITHQSKSSISMEVYSTVTTTINHRRINPPPHRESREEQTYKSNHTPTSILPTRRRKCNMRSKIQWLTDFCSSHYISQFAAFFIDSRAKISIVKSYKTKKTTTHQIHSTTHSIAQQVTKTHQRPTITHSSIMILPQVHLRKPCYDFTFL